MTVQRMTGAQAMVRALEELDAQVVFGIPGGAILPAYDPLFDSKKVRHRSAGGNWRHRDRCSSLFCRL